MNRRSFFTRIAKAVAIAAAAPIIVREAMQAMPVATKDPFWISTARSSFVFDEAYEKALTEMGPIFYPKNHLYDFLMDKKP